MNSADLPFGTSFNENPNQLNKDNRTNEIKAEDEADLKAKQGIFEEHFKPPTGRKQHSRTAVLLMYWEDNDIKVGPEVEELSRVFESKYNFEVEPFQLRSQKYPTPELQLETALVRFLCDYASPNTLYIIYYAGHGWINSGDGDDEDFKLGAQTTSAALENRRVNQLVWINAEKVLHKRDADILLIFDCCYAGSLRKCYRGAHTFEFLGACDEEEKTFGPGPKSFTKFLIRALMELAENEQGFDTKALLSKTKSYKDFSTTNLNPVLFHRDYRSTAHIWIEPVPSNEAAGSRHLEAELPNDQSTDSPTSPEWLEFSFIFNRPQEFGDIKNLAQSLTEFTANHTFLGLERVTLQAKSPNPRLGWPYVTQWLDRVRHKSSLGHRSELTAPAGILIQESPALETPTDVAPRVPQDDSKFQAPVTPISGVDGPPSDSNSDLEPIRKRVHSQVDHAESDTPKIRYPKRQRTRRK